MGVDDHDGGNAPRGAILLRTDYPEEGTVEDTSPNPNQRKGRIEYELPGPPVRRVIEDDWREPGRGGKVRRVGNAEAAGLRCITPESPEGVIGHQYRRMVRRPPVTFEAPPGPIEVQGLVLMDPSSREYLYDLDEVAAWNERRPGRGKRGKWRSRQGRDQAVTEGEPQLASAKAG